MKDFFINKKKVITSIAFLSILSLTVSCDEESRSSMGDTNAVVVGKAKLDCKSDDAFKDEVYIIKLMSDTPGKNNSSNLFYELNLPKEYQQANKPITITHRAPTKAEMDLFVSEECQKGSLFSYIYIESIK
ncbi:hypothetical protein EIZ47_04275 [Chryseobacterium lacus]|uniref:Lipoprotein n=1 Tax=Chryseobacterium lacus TaxID=2058346 RepID=A0A368MZH6_9FLAO|nr:hypothetical protein [Chryseobacterium lacus]RCU43396.1 hypothetical protein DQ356_04315 [Chryseobacterium lacus]RST28407.1 hypothetical protein EIZ47_04275 [Chryseobacterium lacus]